MLNKPVLSVWTHNRQRRSHEQRERKHTDTSECLLSAQSVLLMTGVVHQDAAAPLWSASRLSGKSLCNHSHSIVARGDLFTG